MKENHRKNYFFFFAIRRRRHKFIGIMMCVALFFSPLLPIASSPLFVVSSFSQACSID
jgi:hypothetical protein